MPRRSSDAPVARGASMLAGLPLSAPSQPGKGAQRNNMAPLKTNSPANTPNILQQGIDTLVLNVYGVLKEDVLECLAMAKEDAQSSGLNEALSPLPPFDGVTPLMQGAGVKYYEWFCLSRDLQVKIKKPNRSKRPAAVIRLSSECLWRLGGGGEVAARLATDYLVPLFEPGYYSVQVSTIHVATDYQGYRFSTADRAGIVKRARVLREHLDDDGQLEWYGVGDDCTGMSAGKSNALRLNFYNKTREVKFHQKEWFFSLWERQKGYVADEDVWRLEFQFGRDYLHERGLETLDDVLGNLSALWTYATAWFSFRIPNQGDQLHRSRWPVAPWWSVLSTWGAVKSEALPRVKQVRPRFQALCQGLLGYITSVAAVTEAETLDDAYEYAKLEIGRLKGRSALEEVLAAKRLRYAGFTMASA